MKNDNMARFIGLADEKYVEEAAPALKRRRQKPLALALVAAVLSLAIIATGLFLFVPYSDRLPSLDRFKDSEYYELMKILQPLTTYDIKTEATNNFDRFFGAFEQSYGVDAVLPDAMGPNYSSGESLPNSGTGYVETTDNQVEGVIESDRIKRSTTHIFYLGYSTLYIYSIEGEDSELVGKLKLKVSEYDALNVERCEFYLSEDCTRVTVIAPVYTTHSSRSAVEVISIDVSDLRTPVEVSRFRLSGSYVSARLVDGELLVVSNFIVYGEPNFDNESEFVPQLTVDGEERLVSMDDIFIPEGEIQNARYTVIVKLDEGDLSVKDEIALLSYSEELYVSQDKIFASMGYLDVSDTELSADSVSKKTERKVVAKTEIAVIDYSGESFEALGSVTVDGTVLNQYSMDEHEGILRVVSTVSETYSKREELSDGAWSSMMTDRKKNTSLFCIDLEDFSIVASVEGFAPEGEEVTSVRFEGDICYVCTADTKYYRDPVYFFDLSDLENITYTDTGDIEGYSSSLVDMGEGFLLGIGYIDSIDSLKLEMYIEQGESVRGIASVERYSVSYSDDYKSYFIDREYNLVGLAIYDYNTRGTEYVLYGFDGFDFVELYSVTVDVAGPQFCRGVLIDGVFYVFAENHLYTQRIIFGESK